MAPRLMALHRFVDAAEAGHDDRRDLGIAGEGGVEDVHAVGVGQPQVDDQRVVGEALEAVERRRRRRRPARRRSPGLPATSAISWRSSASSSTTRTVGRGSSGSYGCGLGTRTATSCLGSTWLVGRRSFQHDCRLQASRQDSNRHASSSIHARLEVLVVDDDEAVREVILAYFDGTGHAGRPARPTAARPSRRSSGRSGRFGLVVTDLSLPGADGLAVLQAARQANASSYVVIVTGYASLDSAIARGAARRLRLPDQAVLARTARRHPARIADRAVARAREPAAHRTADATCSAQRRPAA